MTQENILPAYDPTNRLFKLASEKDNEDARAALNESHKSIEWYYALPPDQFALLRPELQSALNGLRKLYEYEELARKSLLANTPSIKVDVFARRYYRWLRGENVPEHVLNSFNMNQEQYINMLFNEWCSNIGRATVPVWIDDENGEHIYLLPSLHCRDMISVREQVGFITEGPGGERFVPSAGAINDNFNKINMLQTHGQKEYAMKKLFDQTVSVNGTKDDAVKDWVKAWKDAIEFFDKAFGLEPINAQNNKQITTNQIAENKKESGYVGKISDAF
jgi:hypothetical protein